MEQSIQLPPLKLNPWMFAFAGAAILAIVLYYENKTLQNQMTPAVAVKKPCNCHEQHLSNPVTEVIDPLQNPPTAVID